MAITSASTLADILGQIKDHAGYAASGSLAAGQAFVEAVTALLALRPTLSRNEQEHLQYSNQELLALLQRAEAWVASRTPVASGGSGFIHADFADFRS